MKTVYKYPLQILSDQRIEIPKNATILHVAEQFGVVHLWAMVDNTDEPKVKRHISIYGSGYQIPVDVEAAHFVGTVLFANGALVWHVFDLGEVE